MSDIKDGIEVTPSDTVQVTSRTVTVSTQVTFTELDTQSHNKGKS